MRMRSKIERIIIVNKEYVKIESEKEENFLLIKNNK